MIDLEPNTIESETSVSPRALAPSRLAPAVSGVAVSAATMKEPAELVRAADATPYHAKARGGNRVEPGLAGLEGPLTEVSG
jgi:hypothetical protein